MIKFICAFFVLLQGFTSFSQGFGQLGSAEKIWVLLHPFSAKRAQLISKKAIEITDSISETENWLKINSGGRKDAFRHGIWMAMLGSNIGSKRAIWLGEAHEKKNVKDFKKGRLEEDQIPDCKSIEMDLYNNQVGVGIGALGSSEVKELIGFVLTYIKSGKFKIIKMDEFGNSRTESGMLIPKKEWEGMWINERVLIPSN